MTPQHKALTLSDYAKIATLIAILVSGLTFVGNLIIRAQALDTVKQEINANDTLDAEKFFSNQEGTKIQTKLESIEKNVDKNTAKLEKIESQNTQMIILLNQLNNKQNRNDST